MGNKKAALLAVIASLVCSAMADAKERPHDRFAVQPWQPPASVLVPDKAVSTWFDRFSADDEELYTNTVSNAEGLVVLDEGKTEKKTWR